MPSREFIEDDLAAPPFPTARDVAAPAEPKYKTFALPEQQQEFDKFTRDHHSGLLRKGLRRWFNPSNNLAKLAFHLEQPRWLDPCDPNANRVWPPEARQIIITIKPGSECAIPEMWSRAIVTVGPGGEAQGGLCPWLRPLGCAPITLAEGLTPPEPYEPPTGAA